MNKKLYLMPFLWLLASSCAICSMKFDRVKNNIGNVASGKISEVNMKQLEDDVAELSKNKATYKNLMRLLHPDRTRNNEYLQELCKIATVADGVTNRPQIEQVAATPEDLKIIIELRRKEDKIRTRFDENSLLLYISKNYSFPTAVALKSQYTIRYYGVKIFIHNAIATLLSLFSNNCIKNPYVTDFQKIIDRLRDNRDIVRTNQDFYKNEIRQLKNYNNHLQKTIAHYDSAIKRKLERHLPQGK